MKSISKLLAVALTTTLAGCSYEVVPPASKGKILTTQGYSPDILEPAKYTLWGRDEMIILETNTGTYGETVKVILQDKLTLLVDVRFRGRIGGDKKTINAMFNDISPGEDRVVSFNEVYQVYGKMIIRNKTREIISQYNVEDVHKNYARLSKEIGSTLAKAFETTPLELSDVVLGNIQYPEVVTKAINEAKERELSIKKEEAQAKINLTKKKNEQLLAKAQREIEITIAKTIRDKNKIIGEGITPALLELKRLDTLVEMAKSGSTTFMPFEAMNTVGAQTRVYNK